MAKLKFGSLLYLGIIFTFFFCLISAILWQTVLDVIMKRQLQIEPSSIIYKMWIKNPLPIYLEIYIFNLTNAASFAQNKSVIPNFKEVGPFVFEETREKVDISWSDSQDEVTFNQTKSWRLLAEQSEDFSVPITNLNPIALTIAHLSRLWKSDLQKAIANTLINKHEPLIVTATAKEWLFEGIPDKFLEMMETLRKVSDIPIPYDKFGWFYQRNMSSAFDGTFTIKTGKSLLSEVGMMVTWNKQNKTEHYEGHCGLVYGTTGEIIPPLELFQKNITVFASEICSYVTLKYNKVATCEEIECYEYVGDESVFDNGTLYPENKCFYPGESCPSGSRNVSSCRFGSPAYISFPHFYLADPQYSGGISGMKPNEKDHKFILKVEPTLGVPLSVKGSFQINFRLDTYSWCDVFQKAPKIYIPMIWFTQKVKISQDLAIMFKVFFFLYNYGSFLLYGIVALLFIFYVNKNRQMCL